MTSFIMRIRTSLSGISVVRSSVLVTLLRSGRLYVARGNAPLYPPSVALEQRARPRWESSGSALSFSFGGERPRRFPLRNTAAGT